MATKPQTSRRSADIGEQLQKTLDETPEGEGATEAPEATEASQKAAAVPAQAKRALPTEKTKPTGRLEDKTILIYGQPKIGKSTLASEFGDRMLFFDTEGGLGDLEVFKMPIPDWDAFLEACKLVADNPGDWDGVVVDTADILALYCSQWTNAKLGIVHESDAEYGKGWSLARQEFTRALAKLAAIPNLGLIIVSHSKDVEIKTRNSVYNKAVVTLTGQMKDVVLNLSDLILYCEFEDTDEGERRVIHTKASRYYDAGERGKSPRLPETLPMSFSVLKAAWEK